jgi:ubiquinone/menaquinone biosynthesis C-methylase UbiE
VEKQKLTQKKWYDHKVPSENKGVIQISTDTHIKRLKGLLPTQEVRLSLNCGCGRGGQNNIFGPSIGMDISFENIQCFKEAGSQGVVADVEFLPFKDDAFDMVYGFGILHHLIDVKKGVSEAIRVLEKGGYIGFGGENNGLCPLNYIMPFIYRNWKIEKGFYRIRENILQRIFQELGIAEIKTCTEGMTIYGMSRMIYKITHMVERLLSRFPMLKKFSGYCYIAGKKVRP